jgi:hypothetical protein
VTSVVEVTEEDDAGSRAHPPIFFLLLKLLRMVQSNKNKTD